MASKVVIAGHASDLRPTQSVSKMEKPSDIERARENADPDSVENGNGKSVTSNGGSQRTASRRRAGQDQRVNSRRMGRGGIDWGNAEGEGDKTAEEALPASLRQNFRQAGSLNRWNIPFELLAKQKNDEESPQAAHSRLLTGLRNMVGLEISQYTKQNDPPYAKKTLRDIFSVLNEGEGNSGGAGPGLQTLTGDPIGFNETNMKRARATFDLLENPKADPGEMFELVA
jgi:hypothetical protein